MAPDGKPPAISAEDWLIVISQTCDIVAGKLEAEPYAEILHCKPIAKIRSPNAGLRSTRYLDFKPNRQTHPETFLTAHAISSRCLIPRELLADIDPDKVRKCDEVAIQRIAAWYALRYSRPAWPDSLVMRIRDQKDKFAACITELADDLEVRIAISPNDKELAPEEPYLVAVYFVVDAIEWDSNPVVREKAAAAYAAFVTTLSKCSGIKFDDEMSAVVSGAEFTWQQTRTSYEWNFASLSYAD